MLHQTFTNRYEIKYLATYEQSRKLQKLISRIFELDQNASNSSGYYNYSIYFDSPQYYFYREKQEGLIDRMKPRLRTHLKTKDAWPDQWFLELKGRHNRILQKRRIPVAFEEAQSLLNGYNHLKNKKHEKTVLEFEYMWVKYGLRPSVAVLYFREPFNSSIFKNVRITFDYRISGSLNFNLNVNLNQMDLITQPADVIVELKYTNSIPNILLEIFRSNEIQQVTFSKYAICLESCVDRLPGISGYTNFASRKR